eukprot:scaffold27344_cov56-Cyclotella_meneghiniana.AAC.1
MAAIMNRSHITVRFLHPLFNKRTHLSKQIQDNAIAIASTSQKKKQTMASVPPSGELLYLPFADEAQLNYAVRLRAEKLTAEDMIYKLCRLEQGQRGAGGELQHTSRSGVKNR